MVTDVLLLMNSVLYLFNSWIEFTSVCCSSQVSSSSDKSFYLSWLSMYIPAVLETSLHLDNKNRKDLTSRRELNQFGALLKNLGIKSKILSTEVIRGKAP